MTKYSGAHNALKEQLVYQREEIKAFDARFGWSSLTALSLIVFIGANAFHDPIVRNAGDVWNRLFLLAATTLGLAAFLVAVAKTMDGVLYNLTPRLQNVHGKMCNTGLLSVPTIAAFKTVDDFAETYGSLDDDAIEQARVEEVWRTANVLAYLNQSLRAARVATMVLGGCALFVAVEALITKGNIIFEWYR